MSFSNRVSQNRRTFWLRFSAFTFYLVLLSSQFASAFENENPVVKNFSKSDYSADNQNWSIAEDAEGIIYFANNKGLLEFDGISWKLYPSPNGNIIRCVAVDKNNRIYTSGYRELGYWERNKAGSLKYVSLTPLADKYFIPNVEFWNIIPVGNKVYFHSFMQILVWRRTVLFQYNYHPSLTQCFSLMKESL